jgi:hypothetical protein
LTGSGPLDVDGRGRLYSLSSRERSRAALPLAFNAHPAALLIE